MNKALNFLFDVLAMATFLTTILIGFLVIGWLSSSFVAFELLPIQWTLVWFLVRAFIVGGIIVGVIFASDTQGRGDRNWIK